MNRPTKTTPMFEQYFELKRQVPDAIVFFRLGDFYEMFFEDAEKAAPLLDLVLTARGKGGECEAPMCGVPYHAADQYVAKLIRHGLSVAVCEQVEEPGAGKGLVRREIVRIVSPGTAVDGSLVDRDSCYLVGIASNGGGTGAAWLDVSTGDFFVTGYEPGGSRTLLDDLSRLRPREAVVPRQTDQRIEQWLASEGIAIAREEDDWFDPDAAQESLARHFGTQGLAGFGVEGPDLRVAAAAGALRYAASRHRRDLSHVTRLRIDSDAGHLLVDASTLRNLEIFDSRERDDRATLWHVLDQTRTAMGGRMLRTWISRPLASGDAIFDRHDALDELTRDLALLERLTRMLASVADLERLAARVSLRTATPRECVSLASSLETIGRIQEEMRSLSGPLLTAVRQRLDPLSAIGSDVSRTLADEPPASVREGGAIRAGVDADLDQLRALAKDSKSILLRLESEERSRTGISSLKIRYNNVFGYSIEVSKANLSRVPAHYIRRQTLVNAERFITPELKEIEEKILGAEDKSLLIEQEIYDRLLARVAESAPALLATAHAVAEVDTLTTLAAVAVRRRYVRPLLSDSLEIRIEEGRHPVVEAISAERFVPNDTDIQHESNGLQIVTGPNMGGKSTYLRQVALIVLMNQIGSFVPATHARLGVFDRIFTRVGASDNLARGESTFMVEMQETANILNNATERSLVILDEVGRGTATFDGLSLAWAIIEYLHDVNGSITLFATHYHELTDLAETKTRVVNANVAVKEWKDQIIFLRKVVPGAADKSYGIQVARLAGVPPSVTRRAREILTALEQKEHDVVDATRRQAVGSEPRAAQMSLFGIREQEVLDELRSIDADGLTPLEALNRLHDLSRRLRD
ncbi:MAG TPA: DNA mismatch repair protein MutS [Thermoanaerobaculia bacterium]|nr:DNA mismatch repair protein MutS [Thermoanaerobaculia bacterium]